MSRLDYSRLTPAEQEELIRLLEEKARTSRYSPHEPTPRQKKFLECTHKEAFYGGSAGGGKSDCLLMAALQYADVPGYSALILRRTFQDLAKPGALLDRAREWLQGSTARWNEQKKQWRFPSGATLSFGYLETEQDKYQYQGAEYQFIAFDELSQFTETQYLYLFSRLRRLAGTEVPLRMRSASNPGGVGHQWVQERFIPDDWTPEQGNEIRVIEKEGRAFVPAKLRDNPHLDQEAYEASLAELDDVTRAQLLEGDWQVRERGNIFPHFEDGPLSRHVITWSEFEFIYGVRRIPDHWRRAIGHDWGSTEGHPAVVSLIARSAANSALPGLYFLYWGRTFKGALVDHVAEVIQAETAGYAGAIEIWRMSHEAKSERDTYRVKFSLPFHAMKSGKTDGIAQIRHMLRIRELDKLHPFKPQLMGRPLLYLVVDDSELINPKTDDGLARHRGEFAAYRYADTPPTAQRGQAVPVPYKWFDDAMDSLRGICAEWGPEITPLTEDEKLEASLPENLRRSTLDAMPYDFQRDMGELMRDYRLEQRKKEKKEQGQNWTHGVVSTENDDWVLPKPDDKIDW